MAEPPHNGTGNDIFVDTSIAGQLMIRWNATNETDNSTVNFAVVLFSDGRIRFDYGAGNTGLVPTIGISRGDGQHGLLVSYDGHSTLTNATSVQFGFAPSFADIGAYEFLGSSLDTTPPTVTSTVPAVIDSSGSTSQSPSQIQVSFSEPVNVIDANALANYEFRGAGPDGIFGNSDDTVYVVQPNYTAGSLTLTLQIAGGSLPVGTYRLTIFSNSTSSVHDLAGLQLDGDANGTAGGAFVRTFSVTSPLLRGDFNLDGRVTNTDIQAMLDALTNLNAYKTAHGLSDTDLLTIGDINRDGAVTTADVSALLKLLTGTQVATTVPLLGDFNLDGQLTAADIPAMMNALMAPVRAYKMSNALSVADLLAIGDVNGDGKVNNADLQALLNALKSPPSGGSHSLVRGDFNQDGQVTAADIPAAINALANLTGYQSQHGLTNANLLTIFDVNADGKVTNADLQALLISLKGGGGSVNGSGSSVPSDIAKNSDTSSGISNQSDSLVLGSAIRNISRTSLPQSGVIANPENQASAIVAPLPELTYQSIFVGPLETQLPSVLAIKRGLLNQPASQYSPSTYQFRLLPNAVDQALLSAENDHNWYLVERGENRFPQDAFDDDSISDIFAHAATWY